MQCFYCKPCKFNCVNRILSPLFSVGCNGNRCGNFNSDSAFYFKEEPTKLQARIRIVIHFCLIQAIVMTEGFLLGWYKNFPMALLVFAMVTAVYLLTFLFSYITRTSTAKSINESLKNLTQTRIIRTNNCILTYKIATYSPLLQHS